MPFIAYGAPASGICIGGIRALSTCHAQTIQFTKALMVRFVVCVIIILNVLGGLTWEILDRVYEHGAGYSDVHVLHVADGTPYLGALFQRTLYEQGAEGGGYNLAFAKVQI